MAVQVRIERTEGSAPRDAGTTMVVMADDFLGTIGGGHLEHVALAHARALLQQWAPSPTQDAPATLTDHQRWALGPSMGQCCGGVVYLAFTAVDAQALRQLGRDALQLRPQVAVFGGGHVGDALLAQLLLLDYRVLGYDSREAMFAVGRQDTPLLQLEQVDPIADALADLPPACAVLIMSFSHAEDLDVEAACLTRQRLHGDLKFVGLIGSKTKWATFQHRLEAKGFTAEELAFITCPIGVSGITGKEPEVIAVSVAAQLLQLEA